MDFTDIVCRVENMLNYGSSKEEIHDRLVRDGVHEDIIFLAFVAAKMRFEQHPQ
jgi:ATP sulfurylase